MTRTRAQLRLVPLFLASLLTAASILLPGLPAEAQTRANDPHFNETGSWGQDYPDQWAIRHVGFTDGADSAWALTEGRLHEVVVAVIDTGLDWHHADFGWDQVWRNTDEIPDNGIDDDQNGYVDDVIGWNFLDDSNNPFDLDGHGTFVAGIIAADTDNGIGIRGINPAARIMVLKALNTFGHTRASEIAEAITYAVDNGARIINLSVGGAQTTRVEEEALAYAASRGVVVIVAAGNEGIEVSDWGPAGSDHVITVASTDFDDVRTVFSNWGRGIDIAAPGLDILSLRARRTDTMRDIPGVEYEPGAAYVGEDRRYYRASGTSFSTPIVAGAASLLLSSRPELSGEEVEQILLNTARDIGSPGIDQYTGYGLLDARALMLGQPGFVTALISHVEVVQIASGPAVRVFGQADASRFAGASLQLGVGENPAGWTEVVADVGQTPDAGALGDIPAASFAGSAVWTLRLVVDDGRGGVREARYLLNLGG